MSPLDSPHSYLSNSAKSGSFCPFTEISTDLLSPLQIHISYPIWVICLMYIPSIPDVFEKSCRLTLSLRGSCSSRWTGAAQGFCCNGNVTASRTLLGGKVNHHYCYHSHHHHHQAMFNHHNDHHQGLSSTTYWGSWGGSNPRVTVVDGQLIACGQAGNHNL